MSIKFIEYVVTSEGEPLARAVRNEQCHEWDAVSSQPHTRVFNNSLLLLVRGNF